VFATVVEQHQWLNWHKGRRKARSSTLDQIADIGSQDICIKIKVLIELRFLMQISDAECGHDLRLCPRLDRRPRPLSREDLIETIRVGLAGGFDSAHAFIVRPLGDGWQIMSGHHRAEAARRAKLTEVPCWVRDIDDDAANLMLATSNSQGELTALERGGHALHSGMEIKAYAESVGRARQTVDMEVQAARVADAVLHVQHDLADRWRCLREIHAAPYWLWPSLVPALLDKHWWSRRGRLLPG
jgi:ParB-like nuclease domain